MSGYRKQPPASWRRTPLPADWPRIREAVLERDDYACQIRGPRCAQVAREVDHIGDRDDHRLEVLQAVCTPCHASKTGRENADRKPKRRRPPEKHPGLID